MYLQFLYSNVSEKPVNREIFLFLYCIIVCLALYAFGNKQLQDHSFDFVQAKLNLIFWFGL